MLRDVNVNGVRNFALRMILSGLLGLLCFHPATLLAQSMVALTWNPSTDTEVTGYKIYSGTVSHHYTNVVTVGNVTNATISRLFKGVTYYFAATTYDDAGNESEFSNEATFSTATPDAPPLRPSLDGIPNLTVSENAAKQTVNLTGLTLTGSPFDILAPQILAVGSKTAPTLKVTVKSSNPAIIPTPVVSYVSPKSMGSLAFKPAANVFGSSTITVTVNNGARTNNTFAQTFTITVLPSPQDYPAISRQPTNTMAVAGNTVSLSVAATGLATLKYQWLFNGTKIPSATGTTLTLKKVTSAQGGAYSVTVTNSLGIANTVFAMLSVFTNAAAEQQAISQSQGNAQKSVPESAVAERVAQVVPVEINPAAVLTPIAAVNGQFSLQVAGIDHSNYVVQASADLVNWSSLQTNSSPFIFTETNANAYNQRFYRANELP